MYWECDYLPMLGLKLNHVSEGVPDIELQQNEVWIAIEKSSVKWVGIDRNCVVHSFHLCGKLTLYLHLDFTK